MRQIVAAAGLVLLASWSSADAAIGARVEGVFYLAGSSTEITEAQVGQDVLLVVMVTDTSDDPGGIVGGYVDVTWDPNVLLLLDEIDDDETTTADIAALFDDPWTSLYKGKKTSDGSLEGVAAGLSPPFDDLSGGATVEFFALNFRAQGVGPANVTLNGYSFGLYNNEDVAVTPESSDPALTVIEADPNSDPNNTGSNGSNGGLPCCFSTSTLLGVLMAAGCGCVLGRRRQISGR